MTIKQARQPEGIPIGGRFANKTNSESSRVLEAAAAAIPDVHSLNTARDELRERWDEVDWNAEGTPDTAFLDQQMQHASIQLAAAVILRDYPGAATLALRENEDGEKQYDMLAVRDANGTNIVSTSVDNDWTFNEVTGANSAELGELGWSLNVADDTWAEGIAEITHSKAYGKSAEVDLQAALAKPAPVRTPTTTEIIDRRDAAFILAAKARHHARMATETLDHANIQVAAALVMEKFPEAETLHLRDEATLGTGFLEAYAVSGPDGNTTLLGEEEKFETELDGAVELHEYVGSIKSDRIEWARGIASPGTYRGDFDVDLKAALEKPAPVFEAMNDPKTRLLSGQEQADLVEAAYYGLSEIEDAVESAENNSQANHTQELLDRLQTALKKN